MSGTEAATTTAGGTATETATTATTAATGTDTTTTGATGTQGSTERSAQDWQAEVDKWKALSRQNEAKAKANHEADAAQRKLLADVAAKLGIATADGQPDAAQITAQLEAAQRQNQDAALELAVLRAAGSLKADGDKLLDSRAFRAQLDGLDPAQPEGIKAAIQAALAADPGRYGQTAPAGGTAAGNTGTTATTTAGASTASTFAGSPGGNRQWTQEDVNRATPAEVTKAMEQGLLKQLLSS